MPHDVFVSYSSRDKPIADAVTTTLELRKIGCWVAPRDIVPGVSYGESIIDALDNSRAMVLIFSTSANASPQVMREVERAVSKGLTIIPFRIEDVTPCKSMEYYISASHWLDAWSPPLESHTNRLVEAIQRLLGITEEVPPAQAMPAPLPIAPQTLEAGEQSPGLRVSDLLTLPEAQRDVLNWMLRQRKVTLADVVAYPGQDEASMRTLLAELLEKGYVREVKARGVTHYRVRLAPH